MRLLALVPLVAVLACDIDSPVAWIYYGDSAISRGVQHITRLHNCDYVSQAKGGLQAFAFGPNRQDLFEAEVEKFHDAGKMVNVWLTIGTVDRTFYLHSPGRVAESIERIMVLMAQRGADQIFYVTYNDILVDPGNPFETRQDFVDLIDFDSRPRFTLIDLRDLNDMIVGVDNFHYSPAEHLIRGGAVHARITNWSCKP